VRYSALGARRSALGARGSALGARRSVEHSLRLRRLNCVFCRLSASTYAVIAYSASVGRCRKCEDGMTGKGFRELEVWRLAMVLVEKCYEITRRLPIEERYGLSGQIRRAAVSIPANVAEGHTEYRAPSTGPPHPV